MSRALGRRRFRVVLTGALAIPVLLLTLIGSVLAWQVTKLVHASGRAQRTEATLEQTRHVYRRFVDLETGLRGYLVTGDARFLAPHDEAREVLPELLQGLASTVSTDASGSRDVEAVRAGYDDLVRYADEMIALRRQNGPYASVRSNALGKAKMDAIRAHIEDLSVHYEQRERRDADVAQRSGRQTLWAACSLTVLGGLVIGLYVRRQMLAVAASYDGLLEDLAALNRTLEDRVVDRTERLTEANQELEAFAYSVSHDLRAPLRSVQGLASILLEDHSEAFDATGRDYAGRIVASAERMDALIQDLLRYARLSRAELPRETCPLRRAVEAAIEQLDKPARACVTVEEPLPPVTAHFTTLVQVLVNLLSNAVKFVTPGARPTVRVSAEQRDGQVRIMVRDHGIGIAPEHQARIFRVFERLHSVDAYPGTGIGLAIVRKGVERMGGRAGVESVPGEGSTFWIELPRGAPS